MSRLWSLSIENSLLCGERVGGERADALGKVVFD
jgi:hypothetical protein